MQANESSLSLRCGALSTQRLQSWHLRHSVVGKSRPRGMAAGSRGLETQNKPLIRWIKEAGNARPR
eukprot:scaffold2420_cov259-Pinguiococcus_pyrenoidosus.AAC.18